MLTEFEVRRRLAEISAVEASPLRRVRMYLRIAIQLRRQVRSHIHVRDLFTGTRDPNTTSHLERMISSLRTLYEEVRLAAWNTILSWRAGSLAAA